MSALNSMIFARRKQTNDDKAIKLAGLIRLERQKIESDFETSMSQSFSTASIVRDFNCEIALKKTLDKLRFEN